MNLANILISAEEKYKNKVAIKYNEKEKSFSEILNEVKTLAAGLLKLGVTAQDKVALLLPNTPEFITTLFACLFIGAKVVPINFSYKSEELSHIFNEAQIKFCFSLERSAKILSQINPQSLKEIILVGEGSANLTYQKILEQGKNNLSNLNFYNFQPEETAVIIYTNAQSGYSLGAMLTSKSIYTDVLLSQQVSQNIPEDVFLGILPFYHGFGLTTSIFLPMLCGSSIVLIDRFLPAKVLEIIAKEKITFFTGVPAMFIGLAMTAGGKSTALQSVKKCIAGGSALSLSTYQIVKDLFNLEIKQGYGITECPPVVSVNPLLGEGPNKPASVGKPYPTLQVKILNDQDKEMPVGEVGEVVIKGDIVFKGYLNKAEETKKYLKDGWFYTGDLGKFDEDGYLYLTGLKKKMLIVGGFNVYFAELKRIIKQIPQIEEVEIIAKEDAIYGSLPKAKIKLKSGEQLTSQAIINYCKEKIAGYKVPREVEIIK